MEEPKIEVGQIYQGVSDDCLYEIVRILNNKPRTFMVTCLDSRVGRGDCPMTEKQIQDQIGFTCWILLTKTTKP